jgi:hypothetical protein
MHEITSLTSCATHSRQRVGAIAQGGVGAQTKEVTESARRARRAGSLALRRARFRHRIELTESGAAAGQPCWTLVVTGPKVQDWGFFCSRGRFVPCTQFDGGCGEDQR